MAFRAGTHALTPMYTRSGCVTEHDINVKNVGVYKARHGIAIEIKMLTILQLLDRLLLP